MAHSENQLITLLPRVDRMRLLEICEPVDLVVSDVLCRSGEPMRHVYFPIDGFISVVSHVDLDHGVDVGLVGREGMLGIELILGIRVAPLHALVQGPGAAWRIGTAAFVKELAKSPALVLLLNNYLYTLMSQMASSSACTRFHLIGPRLARCLLMSQDRAHSDNFRATHQFLANMLGVRRVGITTAAGALRYSGLVSYSRGEMIVLDRRGLEAQSCSCYAAERRTYSDWVG